MDSSALRRYRVHLALLLGVLVLLTSAERRLAYLDFNSSGSLRIENNDRPDGDEILNRLVFVDDATEPRAPAVGEACHAAFIPLDSSLISLVVLELSESRAPPYSLSLFV